MSVIAQILIKVRQVDKRGQRWVLRSPTGPAASPAPRMQAQPKNFLSHLGELEKAYGQPVNGLRSRLQKSLGLTVSKRVGRGWELAV